MTAGHRHRTIRLTEGSLLLRLLRHPLKATSNRASLRRSRWVYGMVEPGAPRYPSPIQTPSPPMPVAYLLTPLSICHTLFGLTVEVTDPKERT